MGEQAFVAICKQEVLEYAKHHHPEMHITENDVYVVWLCKVLRNNKALLSTTVEDGMYFELTHNGTTGELYVDAYQKVDNYIVAV